MELFQSGECEGRLRLLERRREEPYSYQLLPLFVVGDTALAKLYMDGVKPIVLNDREFAYCRVAGSRIHAWPPTVLEVRLERQYWFFIFGLS